MGDNYSQIYSYIGYSVAIGILLGAVYEVFRIVRMALTLPRLAGAECEGRTAKNGFFINSLIFILDILFFVVAGVISAVFIFCANDGKVRGIALFGSLVGFIAYYNSIGRLISCVSGAFIRGISRGIYYFIHRIIKPFLCFIIRVLGSFVKSAVKTAGRFIPKRRTRRINASFKRKGC